MPCPTPLYVSRTNYDRFFWFFSTPESTVSCRRVRWRYARCSAKEGTACRAPTLQKTLPALRKLPRLAPTTRNEVFYLGNLARQSFRHPLRLTARNQHVVFDAHADVLILLKL